MLDLQLSGGTVVDGTGGAGASRRRRRSATAGSSRSARATDAAPTPHGRRRPVSSSRPASSTCTRTTTRSCCGTPTASPSPLHGVTTVFGGNCGFTLAPADADEHVDYLAAADGAGRGHPAAGARGRRAVGLARFGDYLDRVDDRGTAVNAGFLAGHSALRRGGDGRRRRRRRGDRRRRSTPMERAAARRARRRRDGLLDLAGAHAQRRRRRSRCRRAARRATSCWRSRRSLARATPGTQLELIIAGCLNGFTDDEVDLMAVDVARRRPPAQLERARRRARPASTTHQLAASATGPPSAAARVVALTLPQGMQIRLSFLTGFVLDGLPGWRERPRRCRSPSASRLLATPRCGARLDAQAHSPEAGRAREPRALGAARGRRGLHRRDPARSRAARSATSREARARRRSTRCSTSWSPTGCAPGCRPDFGGRARRDVEERAPTCGAIRAR